MLHCLIGRSRVALSEEDIDSIHDKQCVCHCSCDTSHPEGNGLAAFDSVSHFYDQLINKISNDADAYTRHDGDHGAPHVSAVSADRNERAEYEGGHSRGNGRFYKAGHTKYQS